MSKMQKDLLEGADDKDIEIEHVIDFLVWWIINISIFNRFLMA